MQFATAMAILLEVAIDTVHAFFEVDILQVHWDPGTRFWAISRFTHRTL